MTKIVFLSMVDYVNLKVINKFQFDKGDKCMKKIVAGVGFEITGMLILLCSSIITSMNIQNTSEWSTKLGRYWQTAVNVGMLPVFVIGLILLLTGIIFSIWGVFSKKD